METVFIHPEIMPDEVFFTNSDSERFERMTWKTKRAGRVAYDGNGNKIEHDDWFPVFISEKELISIGITLQEVRRKFREYEMQ